MAAACVKLDDGLGHYATKGFPPRKKFSTKPKDAGGGAWQLAYDDEQRKHFKTLLGSKPQTFEDIRSRRIKAEKDGTGIKEQYNAEMEDDKILDGFFLLKHCCVNDPLDLYTVNISGQNLTDSVPKDFDLFNNVVAVNAADNLLSMGPFSSFPSLQELEMPVNAIRGITVDESQFLHLQKLDVSYNNLSPADVSALGSLKQLQSLDISANNLLTLPADISGDVGDSTARSEREGKFCALEKLVADDNRFSSDDVFIALAGLPSLQKNELKLVPHLLLVDGRFGLRTDVNRRKQPHSSRRSSRKSSRRTSRRSSRQNDVSNDMTEVQGTVDVEVKIDATHCDAGDSSSVADTAAASALLEVPPSSAIDGTAVSSDVNTATALEFDFTELNISEPTPEVDASVNDDVSESGLLAPFSQLHHLNLAQNKISRVECLLAVAGWPSLRELIIHDNPFSVSTRSDLPNVSQFLHRKLGIQVHSKKPSALSKPHIEMTVKPSRRVSSSVPVIPRCNVDELLLAIESAPTHTSPAADKSTQSGVGPRSKSASASSSLLKSPLPPIPSNGSWTDTDDTSTVSSGRPSSSHVSHSTGSSQHESAGELPPDSFFMTETGDVSEEQQKSEPEKVPLAREAFESPEPARDGDEAPAAGHVYDGYELLLDIDESVLDNHMPSASDINSNVRALSYALKHPLVFCDSSTQAAKRKPYQPLARKPDVPYAPGKSKAEKTHLVLTNLGSRGTYTEAPLKDELSKDHRSKEFIEAKQLLTEVQQKYRSARVASGAAADQRLATFRHRDRTVRRRPPLAVGEST